MEIIILKLTGRLKELRKVLVEDSKPETDRSDLNAVPMPKIRTVNRLVIYLRARRAAKVNQCESMLCSVFRIDGLNVNSAVTP